MQRLHRYFVYILTNKSKTVLYIGVTNNLEYRIRRHIEGGTFAQDALHPGINVTTSCTLKSISKYTMLSQERRKKRLDKSKENRTYKSSKSGDDFFEWRLLVALLLTIKSYSFLSC